MLTLFLLSLGCRVEPTPNNDPRNEDTCEDTSREIEANAALDLSVVSSDIQFAVDLWGELGTKDSNQFISPYSMTAALGMLHLGARSISQEEMSAVLHIPEDDTIWHETKGILSQELHQPERCDYQLSIANRLFGEAGFAFHSEFLEEVNSMYGAPVQEVAFGSAPESARIEINEWVSEQTKDNIPELFKPGIINSNTRLVLANAIYMNAPWSSPFKERDTSQESFLTESGDDINVDMMYQYEMDIRYYSDDQLIAATLPYEGDELSMTIYVPQEGVLLTDIEAEFDTERYQEIQFEQFETLGNVSIPKFEFRTELMLNEPLINLGMASLFNDRADLSGISDTNLFVKAVVHEAWIKVEEKGTEAAAATGVSVDLESAFVSEYFTADKAFLFTIQDDLTGTLLFMGRVADPTASE